MSNTVISVENLCSISIVLRKREIYYSGDVKSGIQQYLEDSEKSLKEISVLLWCV
jgi:ABC-type polysaccharide/polyol phosphate transport system ATPase subunit